MKYASGVFFGAALLATLFSSACATGPEEGAATPKDEKPFRVVALNTGRIVRSQYEFTYENILHPDLEWLRKTEDLDKVVAGAGSEFEMIKRLAAWTARQWMYQERQRADFYPGVAAIADLRQGMGQGRSCGMFCTVFMDACHSYGIYTRALGIQTDLLTKDPTAAEPNRYAHAVADVWSNDYQKWVLMDGNWACYFEDENGVPQSVWELQAALFAGKAGKIRTVFCGNFAESTAPILARYPEFKNGWFPVSYGQLKIFRNVDVLAADNLLSPSWHPSEMGPNGEKLGAKRIYFLPPAEGYEPYLSPQEHYELTRDPNDVNWNLYEIELSIPTDHGRITGRSVPVTIRTFSPSLDCLLVRMDGGQWQEMQPDGLAGRDATLRYAWSLRDGLNRFEVRARNQRGRLGVIRGITVSNDPLSIPPVYESQMEGAGGEFGSGSIVLSAADGGAWVNTSGSEIVKLKDGKRSEAIHIRSDSGAVNVYKFTRDSAGRFDVVGDHWVYQCDPAGKVLMKLGSGGPGGQPFMNIGGIALDSKGGIYVSEADRERLGRVLAFDAEGRFARCIGRQGAAAGEFNLPSDLAVSAAGELFVVDSGNHRVQVFSPAGKFLRQIGPEIPGYGKLCFPAGVTLAESGGRQVVYIADSFNHRIVTVDSEGRLIGSFGGFTATGEPGKLVQPRSVAVAADRIYVLQPPTLSVFRIKEENP